ncbi:MAG: sce7726 family protein [Eubacterium sp.]|nr:sce7726 family protein [Eubacterium sp.]
MLDKDMREPLFEYLEDRYGKVRIIEEKVIKKSRADVLAIVEGGVIGLEIKSDNDTYVRLARQVKDYDRFCDKCYVVVGESHIHVAEHIPDYWGIIVISQENVIVERDAETCPKVSITNQLGILWRSELLNIQLKEGLPKLASTRRADIYKRLIDTAGEPTIKADICEQLFERDYTIFDNKKPEEDSTKTTKRSTKRASRRKVSRKSVAADKKRAHVTNYVGPRKKKLSSKKT